MNSDEIQQAITSLSYKFIPSSQWRGVILAISLHVTFFALLIVLAFFDHAKQLKREQQKKEEIIIELQDDTEEEIKPEEKIIKPKEKIEEKPLESPILDEKINADKKYSKKNFIKDVPKTTAKAPPAKPIVKPQKIVEKRQNATKSLKPVVVTIKERPSEHKEDVVQKVDKPTRNPQNILRDVTSYITSKSSVIPSIRNDTPYEAEQNTTLQHRSQIPVAHVSYTDEPQAKAITTSTTIKHETFREFHEKRFEEKPILQSKHTEPEMSTTTLVHREAEEIAPHQPMAEQFTPPTFSKQKAIQEAIIFNQKKTYPVRVTQNTIQEAKSSDALNSPFDIEKPTLQKRKMEYAAQPEGYIHSANRSNAKNSETLDVISQTINAKSTQADSTSDPKPSNEIYDVNPIVLNKSKSGSDAAPGYDDIVSLDSDATSMQYMRTRKYYIDRGRIMLEVEKCWKHSIKAKYKDINQTFDIEMKLVYSKDGIPLSISPKESSQNAMQTKIQTDIISTLKTKCNPIKIFEDVDHDIWNTFNYRFILEK